MKFMCGLILTIMLLPFCVFSQALTWEKHQKKAEQLLSEGHFEQAIGYLTMQSKRKDLVDADRIVITTFATEYIFDYGDKKQAFFVVKSVYDDLVKKNGIKSFSASWARELLIQASLRSEEFNKALEYANLAIHAAPSKKILGEAYLSLADVHREREEYNLAIKFYFKAEQLLLQSNNKNKNNSKLGTLYNNLAVTYDRVEDYKNALKFYQSALKTKDKKEVSYYKTLFNMSSTYRDLGEIDKAKRYLIEIADFYLKEEGEKSFDYIKIENELGVLEQDYGHYNEAISHYRKSLSSAELLGRRELQALALKNMGNAYTSLGDRGLAESYLDKALAIYQKLPLSLELADNYEGLALLASEKKLSQQELSYYDKAIAVYESLHQQNVPDYANLLTNKAMAYQKHLENKKAEVLYQQAHTLLQKVEPKGQKMGFLLINLATLKVDKKEYAKAEPMLLEAIAMLKQTVGEKHPDVAYAYNNLAMVYSEQNQHDKSVDCYKKAIEISKATEGPNHPSTKLYNRNLLLEAINKGVSKKRGWF